MNSTNLKRLKSLATIAVAVLAFSTTAFAQSQNVANTDSAVQNITEFKSDLKPQVAPAEEVKAVPKQDLTATINPDSKKTSLDAEKTFEKLRKETATKKFSSNDNADPAMSGKQTNPNDSGWHFAFSPYFFLSSIRGTIGARGRSIEVDASFGNIWENLDFGLMGTFEARKGKLVFVNDLIWTKMSAERNTPGGLYSTGKVGVNLFIIDPEVGYRVLESKAGSLDILGGVRIWSVENNINLTTGTLPGFDVSQRKTWAAPVVGVHGVGNLSSKFFLAGKFDIGGAGIGADLTTQLYGGAGYRVTKNTALIVGYRWLQVDYDDSKGFLFDTQMSGFILGAKFSF